MIAIRECWGILVVLALSSWLAYLSFPPAAAVTVPLFFFTLYFFRDPDRSVMKDVGTLISPADGRILDVEEADDPYVGLGRRIAIFMSPFDVHVNRSPMKSKVKAITHTPGTKVAAYLKGDLSARERNRIELSGKPNLAVEQYAGVVARRIVCYVQPGQEVEAGERIGMIKFGSRVDVIVPLSIEVKVSKGGRVVAGETIIGVVNG